MRDKLVIVGVTGGIAAYKAAELVRGLVKAGAQCRVAMTENASKFITPLTFEALSGHRVVTRMFDPDTMPMDHINWGQEAALVIIAPATANFVAKMAHGLADDFLSTMVLAATARILVCPAMNAQMWKSPAVRENLRVLRSRGVEVLDPGSGFLACRAEGPGRLPEPEDIVETAHAVLSPKDLSGRKILVTAGATVEPMDPVRYITNRSSGKMGYAIARAACMRGADVVLVSGPSSQKIPLRCRVVAVRSAEDMKRAVFAERTDCDAIVKAAAVVDYRPLEAAGQKIKKDRESMTLELVRNPDILADLGRDREDWGGVLVGFAAETQDLLKNARLKLEAKNADMIVANDVSRPDAGFDTDTNLVKILSRDGSVEEMPLMSKDEVANVLLDRIRELWDRTQDKS